MAHNTILKMNELNRLENNTCKNTSLGYIFFNIKLIKVKNPSQCVQLDNKIAIKQIKTCTYFLHKKLNSMFKVHQSPKYRQLNEKDMPLSHHQSSVFLS